MSNEETMNDLKEKVKNAKTVEDIYAVYFTMLEKDLSDEGIAEILNETHLSNKILEEMKTDKLLR